METITFELDPGRDHVELHHLLKLTGQSDSGGAAKQLVATGQVSVDGAVELRKTCKIRSGHVVQLGTVRIEVVTIAP